MARRRVASWWWVLPIAAAVPPIVSSVLAAHGGWTTTIDNAVIAVRARDSLGTHPPLVGIYFSLTVFARSSTRLHHLGPLQFWMLALPLRIGGPNALGLVFGAAAVNGLAAAGSVWVAHRLAGLRLAALTTGAVALLAWSLGGQVLHDPWNPHLALFPFFFFLVAASAVAAGDVGLLPLTVFAASFVLQTHSSYLTPVGLAVIWMVVGLVLALRAEAGRDAVRRRAMRPLIATGVVLVVVWIGPILDQLFGSHNATKVVGAALTGDFERVGFASAWRDLVHATSLPPIWLEPFTGVIKPGTSPDGFAILTSALVLAALVAATGWAWARRSRSHLALCTTAVAAAVGGLLTASSSPVDYYSAGFLYPRRIWWVVGAFVWVALVHTVASLAAALRPDRASRSDVPAVAFGLAAIAVALIAVWPRLGPAEDYGSGGFGAVRALGPPTARALRGQGPWELRSVGGFAEGVVGPGVASQLVLRGRHVVVADANFPDLGPRHSVDPDRPPRGTVLVVSGADAGEPMSGYSLVDRWDPATEREPYRSYRQTLLVIPIEPVAVYVSTAPPARVAVSG